MWFVKLNSAGRIGLGKPAQKGGMRELAGIREQFTSYLRTQFEHQGVEMFSLEALPPCHFRGLHCIFCSIHRLCTPPGLRQARSYSDLRQRMEVYPDTTTRYPLSCCSSMNAVKQPLRNALGELGIAASSLASPVFQYEYGASAGIPAGASHAGRPLEPGHSQRRDPYTFLE